MASLARVTVVRVVYCCGHILVMVTMQVPKVCAKYKYQIMHVCCLWFHLNTILSYFHYSGY